MNGVTARWRSYGYRCGYVCGQAAAVIKDLTRRLAEAMIAERGLDDPALQGSEVDVEAKHYKKI
jgi:hypothetical protein